LIVEKL
jgi:transposase